MDKIFLLNDRKAFNIKTYKDPIFKLINTFKDIKDILNNPQSTKYLYFNVSQIHKILYEYEEILYIENGLLKQHLFLYIYLILLIIYDKDIVNYEFSFDFIKEINYCRKDNFLFKIIKAKICLELIGNYKEFNQSLSEIRENEILKLEEYNKIIFKENIHLLKEMNSSLNKNDIFNKSIDEILMIILETLIKNEKLSDYDYSNVILSELDFENIDLTKNMIDKLSHILNKEEEYIKKYMILDFNNLLDNKIIIFHLILFKYIVKNPIYIYQIDFLLKTRKNIIKILKSNYGFISLFKGNKIDKERFIYVITKYSDVEYYIKSNDKIKKEKKELGKEKEKTLTFQINDDFMNKIFEYSKFIIYANGKEEKQFFSYREIYIGEQKINEKDWKIIIEKMKALNDNCCKLCQFLENFELKIKENIEKNNSLKIEIEFKKDSTYDSDYNYNITCYLLFYNPLTNLQSKFKFKNILNNDNFFDSQDFLHFLYELNFALKKSSEYSENQIPILNQQIENDKIKTKNSNKSEIVDEFNYFFGNISKNNSEKSEVFENQASKEEIIKYIKTMKTYKDNASFIKELKCGFYISLGNEHSLILYNQNFEKVLEIKNLDDWITNIEEKNSEIKTNIEIIAYSNEKINLIIINQINLIYTVQKYKIPEFQVFCSCHINKNSYILSGETNVSIYNDLFNESSSKIRKNKILNKIYISSIKLDENTVVLTSNSVLKNGEDNLIFVDIENKAIKKKISGYSYVYSPNGLSIININQKKIILCSCKKYYNGQYNGILAIDYSDENCENIKEIFFPTDNYEVYCTCQISINDNNDIENNYTDSGEKEIKNTKYFLSGGFDQEKREGVIKLFRINYDNEDNLSNIEYLQDIEFEYNKEFQGFDKIITSIIQSSKQGNILATCSDGNVYLLSKPNLEYYLEEEM